MDAQIDFHAAMPLVHCRMNDLFILQLLSNVPGSMVNFQVCRVYSVPNTMERTTVGHRYYQHNQPVSHLPFALRSR